MHIPSDFSLYQEVMDILPTPVLIKDSKLRYVFINKAFEHLFQVNRSDVLGELDKDVFTDRQVAQCNGGDLRVLATGIIDEAYESVFDSKAEQREVITRKSRLTLPSGETYLVGTIYDITEVTVINQQLLDNQSTLKDQSELLEAMVNTDPLTGCNNRRALDTMLPHLFETADYQGGLLALDIDNFKQTNDTYGHHIGDIVLQKMVEIITDITSEKQILIRMGGEEFLIVCAGETFEAVNMLAEKIRIKIAESKDFFSKHHLPITVSIGISHTQQIENWELDKLLKIADKALYKAKSLGRNRIENN
jgi:diguanylate cyclase (GGDEF)-like protein